MQKQFFHVVYEHTFKNKYIELGRRSDILLKNKHIELRRRSDILLIWIFDIICRYLFLLTYPTDPWS